MDTNTNIGSFLDYLDSSQKKEVKQIRDIIPIVPWIENKYFMGDITIYPYWKDTIIEFFEGGYDELILSGGTGSGKSYAALLVLYRLIYELSCYEDPAVRFGLDATSIIIIFYLQVTQKSASAGFAKLKNFIDQSPYFRENYKRGRINSIIRFPKGKVQVWSGSDVSDFIGSDLYGLILDEGNFLSAGGGDIGAFNKAVGIYRESTNRRKNRYILNGKQHGASIIVSSSDNQSSFTEQRIEEKRNDKNTLVKITRAYDVKPESYSKERFWVFKGSQNINPFIVDEKNAEKYKNTLASYGISNYYELTPPESVKQHFTDIPIDYKSSFELDPYNSLKEVAGVSSIRTDRFFADIDKFNSCLNNTLTRPFEQTTFVVSSNDLRNKLILNLNPNFRGEEKYNYYFSVDQSLTGCRAGIAMGHINDKGRCVIDLMFGITPPQKPEEINIRYIKEFIMYLKEKQNFNITKIITDGYENAELRQFFQSLGFEAFKYSVEKDEPYLFLKNKIANKELEYYDYDIFRNEMFNLKHNEKARKIEHPTNANPKNRIFSKDVCDVVCRIVNNLFLYEPYDYLQQRTTNTVLELAKLNKKSPLMVRKSMNKFDILKQEKAMLGVDLNRIS